MSDPYDLNRLRVDCEVVGRQQRKPKSWRRHYVRVPWQWVEQLQSTKRVSTYRLALVLLYEHWRTGGKPVTLSNVAAKVEGLGRRSKWNALTELAELGLVTIERQARQSPRVVLRLVSTDQP